MLSIYSFNKIFIVNSRFVSCLSVYELSIVMWSMITGSCTLPVDFAGSLPPLPRFLFQ